MVYPHYDEIWEDFPILSNQEEKLVGYMSVAHVQPKTSKGITDMLIPQTSME